MKIKKMHLVYFLLIILLILLAIPIMHLVKTKVSEDKINRETIVGFVDDASQLNLTRVDTIVKVARNPEEILKQLKGIINYAKRNNLKISIAGAKHSMGGHTISPDGIVLDMLPYNQMEIDTNTNILTIGSGALWRDALYYLDSYGKSVSIMQAFSSFSIGGSISVNGHGWQKDLPPLSSSVESFTLLTSTGDVLTCSRTENQEIFKLVLGGYGLFGIILDVKLKVTDNKALKFNYQKLSPENYVSFYKKNISGNSKVNLVFGRLRISEKKFLEEATLNYFEEVEAEIPALNEMNSTEMKRLVFRSSADSEYGKRLRWGLEKGMNKVTLNTVYSRNELLNDDVALIENKDSETTDLLLEFFIPINQFNQFIEEIKPILRDSPIDLLNITIRDVQQDQDTFLSYAHEPVFAFVFLFNQKKTAKQEFEMKDLTNQLLDVTLKNQGTYYLPYRLHISKEKMRLSYPMADEFFQLKLKYDPSELFSNKFYDHYK